MRRAALLVLVLVLAACGGDDEDAAPPATGSTAETQATTGASPDPVVRIETAGGEEVEVAVEIADSPEERQLGLMNRRSLADDAGMIFLFDEDTSGGFWMKNTLIPLSIAFADANGEIQRILDMEPCEADPCAIYDPGVFYRSALEVNQGAFERWGVAEGDTLRLDRR